MPEPPHALDVARAVAILALGASACAAPSDAAPTDDAPPEADVSPGAPHLSRAGGLEARVLRTSEIELVDPASGARATVAFDPSRRVAFTIGERGVEDFVTIDAWDEERPRELSRARIDLDGFAGLRLVDDVLELVDRDSNPVVRASRPVLVDAVGARHRAVVEVEGCAVDRDPRAPWGRRPVEPGARSCTIVASIRGGARPPLPAVLDPLWSSAGMLDEPRLGPSARIGATDVYLLAGGLGLNGPLVSAAFFNVVTKTAATAKSLETPRIRAPLIAIDGPDGPRLLFAGGCELGSDATCTPTASALVYDPGSGDWSDASPLPVALHSYRAVALAGRVYLVGGVEAGAVASAKLVVYDPLTETFAAGPPLPAGRYRAATARLGGGILVVGGVAHVASMLDPANTTYLYAPPPVDAWSTLPDAPVDAWLSELVTLDETRALLFGGSQLQTPLDSAFVFDLADGAWTETGKPHHPRIAPSTILLDNGWLAVVGGDEPTMELYRPMADPADAVWVESIALAAPRAGASSWRTSGGWMIAGGATDSIPRGDVVELALDPLGATCEVGGTCESGECADGVCCDAACDAPCTACVAGRCRAITEAVAEPHGRCDAPAGTCGATGQCDAEGACALAAPGVDCLCVGGVAGACDGSGVCTCVGATCVDEATARASDGSIVSCAPLRCSEGACLAECATSAQCAVGFVCDAARACVPDEGPLPEVGCACTLGDRPQSGLLGAALALACAWFERRRGRRVRSSGGKR